MRTSAAVLLLCALTVSAPGQVPPDEKALATELLAQADGPARERWLASHVPQLTPELGHELLSQAQALQKAGSLEPALAVFALAVRLGELGGDPHSRIGGLRGQGEVERVRGRAPQASAFLERGLQEAEQAGDEAAAAQLSGALGLLRIQLGEYAAALTIFERQLATCERLGDTRGRGLAQRNIGVALGTIGRNEEALQAFERSRELLEAAGDAPGVARAYNNLGLTQRNLGNYAAALEALNHSLQLKEAAGDRSNLPTTLKNIGDVYQFQGARPQALEYFRRSYAIAAELGLKPAMVEALHDEGRALLELDRPQEARAILEHSLALAQEIQGAEAITWVSAALAEVHERLGERARALELLESCQATAAARQELPLVVHSRWQIATLRLADGQAAMALDLAQAAAESARRYELREELWPALLVVGRAQQALGHPEQAEPALREAVDVVEELRAQAVGPEADRAVFLVSRAAPYQELIAVLAESGRPWEALAVSERSKGRVLLDVLAGGRASIGPALDPAERAAGQRLERDLRAANAELRALLLQPLPEAERRARLLAERDARRLALEDFRTRQYATRPELRALRGESKALLPQDARALLADGRTVLLEYALTARQAYLFVLSSGTDGEPALAVRRLELDSSELARLAGELRERLAARDLDVAVRAARLHHALLAPAGEALRRARQVVLVPDGRLWELPFQALRPAGGRYLVEDLAVSYAPSLSVLRDMRAHRHAAGSGPALLAFGNPDPGGPARPRGPSALLGGAMQPLPETETQVREIARLYGPRTAVVRVGPEASESWLKAEASRYRILHLATHGLLDDQSPLYSQLVLAAPAQGERDDGLLEAREILDLRLDAALVVLSACETGRGQAGAGEGLIGMTWAFFVAGCPATVASQWQVEASATSRLMLAFHRELRGGRTPAEALRLAALAQLRRPGQEQPFYWAGFVAMGDAGSPLPPALTNRPAPR